MRILQVLRSRAYGGAENHALGLMRLLRADGHEVACATPEGGWLADRCAAAGIEVFPLAMRGMADVVSYWRLRGITRRWRPDVVHAHLARASQYAGLALAGLPVARVSTCHATTTHRHMRRFKTIIAVSDAVRANLLAHGYAGESVRVVRHGVPDAPRVERAAARAALGIADDVFAVACVGRFVECKGQDVLVEAVRRAPPGLHVWFVGDAETEFGRRVRALAAGEPRVHFAGYRDDVAALLSAFDACAAPSRREALSLALIEAAAAALPLVASDTGGVPEVVVDGETGFLVPVNDAAALASALAVLMADGALACRMGAAARAHYEACFTPEQMLRGTLACYERAMDG